ncbi:potassium channel family protein [Croceicoccus sp. F390]|uniref:Potassium channel family protein n=1 Tax=Croceicoccus esteveae TaxID=3075597 RepID=A0ABU2ZIM4_9SPHN|nr:potassium channel family protein [Croceicoccus sp. F390]MDT0576462.1 potassium channel family protein [Croceicoccus sp. F390]
MIAAISLAVVLFVASLWLHIWLIRCARLVAGEPKTQPTRLTAAYLLVLMSHLAVAALFAAGFAFAIELGLGGFKQRDAVDAMDLFYYSLINITTVGLGNIYPEGHLRAMTGIESLTGFLLISCTAQFVFQTMSGKEN